MTPAPAEAQLYLKIGDSFIPVPWDIYPASLQEAARSIEQLIETDRAFWHSTIQDSTERLRFNGGYEPICVDLYPAQRKSGPAFMGKTIVGHAPFMVEGKWQYDSDGNKILRVPILRDP